MKRQPGAWTTLRRLAAAVTEERRVKGDQVSLGQVRAFARLPAFFSLRGERLLSVPTCKRGLMLLDHPSPFALSGQQRQAVPADKRGQMLLDRPSPFTHTATESVA